MFSKINYFQTVSSVTVDEDVRDGAEQKTMQTDEHSQRKAASRQFNANCIALSQ